MRIFHLKCLYLKEKTVTIGFSTHWHQSVEIFLETEDPLIFTLIPYYFSLKEHQFVIVNSNQVHSIDCPYSNNTIVLQILVETFQLYHRETPYISFIPQSQEKNRSWLRW